MTRDLTYAQALHEAQDLCLAAHPEVILMGLGVPDPTGVFGTTTGLQEKYGSERVFDIPLSENAMTGVALGAAITGMRPIFTHHRVDFSMTSMEQIVNQVAKWHYMFNGSMTAPMTIRMVIGRGWGQGPQHAQSLQAMFAHVPGLKVVMPSTPEDAKLLLVSAILDDNPVIVLEHRWLYGIRGHVPEGLVSEPLGFSKIRKFGTDISIAASSYMTLESLRAADELERIGISAEVIDLRSISPLDAQQIVNSVKKTGRLVIADTGHIDFGIGSEIVARVVEHAFSHLKSVPVRLGLPQFPTPSGIGLAHEYYPTARSIAAACLTTLERADEASDLCFAERQNTDQPDASFVGPF
jgi:pyruvate/2-oxoglutarate/acetoin dehydrogenase E1 component